MSWLISIILLFTYLETKSDALIIASGLFAIAGSIRKSNKTTEEEVTNNE